MTHTLPSTGFDGQAYSYGYDPVSGTSVIYAWDGAGNLTSFTDASGTVTYAYDPANNLTKRTGPAAAPCAS